MNIIKTKEFEELKFAINNSVSSFIETSGNNEKKSLYKSFINNMVNEAFKKETINFTNINSSTVNLVRNKFSGRGKSWVKICKNRDSDLWKKLQILLRNSTLLEKECNDYMDRFELLDFGYIRFYSVSIYGCKFEVRVKGSLKSSKIKLNVSHDNSLNLEFLEGTPISTKLESKVKDEITAKKPIKKENIDSSLFICIEDVI